MRKPRRTKQGARYHITARVNRGEMALESKKMKDLFLAVVKRAKKKYQFSVFHFCIMGNHVHFLLQPGVNENLSRIMQWILSVFALQYNKQLGIRGHFWYDRFFSRIVECLRCFLKVFDYISNNPVRARLVTHPIGFKYSGIFHYHNALFDIVSYRDPLIQIIFPLVSLNQKMLTD